MSLPVDLAEQPTPAPKSVALPNTATTQAQNPLHGF